MEHLKESITLKLLIINYIDENYKNYSLNHLDGLRFKDVRDNRDRIAMAGVLENMIFNNIIGYDRITPKHWGDCIDHLIIKNNQLLKGV